MGFHTGQSPRDVNVSRCHCSLLTGRYKVRVPRAHLFRSGCFNIRQFSQAPGNGLRMMDVTNLVNTSCHLPDVSCVRVFRIYTVLARDMTRL